MHQETTQSELYQKNSFSLDIPTKVTHYATRSLLQFSCIHGTLDRTQSPVFSLCQTLQQLTIRGPKKVIDEKGDSQIPCETSIFTNF